MKIPEQKLALAIGNNGCYFTCLIYLAESLTGQNYDLIDEFNFCCQKIDANNVAWITENGYVNRPDLILAHYLNKRIGVIKTNNLKYVPSNNDYFIGCYKWNGGSHFVYLNKELKVLFDPLGKSNTVKNGKLESLRVITVYE